MKFSSDGDDPMGAKIKTQKSGFQQNLEKTTWTENWDYLINPKTEKNERNSNFGRGRAGRKMLMSVRLYF